MTRFSGGYHGWRIVATLALTETVSWGILYYAFTVFLVPMQADLSFSRAELTGAYSLALLTTGLAAVPVGAWVDRHGARLLMTLGSIAAVLLVLAWSRVHTLLGLYAVFVGIGLVSAAVLYEPAFAVVVQWFSTQRAKALLIVTCAAGFASTIFLPLADALIRALGWRDALVALAVMLAATTVLPHALVLRAAPAVASPSESACAESASPVRSTPPGGTDSLAQAARWAIGDPTFRRLALAFTANALAVVVVSVHLVPFLREHGHSSSFAAAATGSLGLLSVSGRLALTGASRRWSTARVAGVAFGLQGGAVMLLLLAGSTTVGAVLFVLLFGLGFGIGTIARPTLLASAFGVTHYARLSGLLTVSLTVARTAGPVAAGLVRTAAGTYTPVMVALVGVCACASVTLLRLQLQR